MGRPKKYDEELLISEIKKYAKENPMEEITFAKLSRATGIPRHIWSDGTYNIKPVIKRLNKRVSKVSTVEKVKYAVPSLIGDIEKAGDDQIKRNAVLKSHMEYEQALLEIIEKNEEEAARLKAENEKLKNQVERIELMNTSLEKRLARCYVDASNPATKKEAGLVAAKEIIGDVKDHTSVTDEGLLEMLDLLVLED